MSNYTLHLGFNWGCPQIGSIWGKQTTNHRFLQYALADTSAKPWWFQFECQDTLSVVLWDLSASTAPNPSRLVFDVRMSFGPLGATGTQPMTLLPSTIVSFANVAIETWPDVNQTDGMQSCLQFSSISTGTHSTCPWGNSRAHYNVSSPITFTAASSYKLSFYVQATDADTGEAQTFLSDPEVIVGSQGGGRGCPTI